MFTDWKGEFVSLCFLVITSLHVHWLKGRICQSVFLGHHFFTCTLIERENLSVCVSWSSLLYMFTDWKGEFVSLCFLVITSLHVHWLKGRICQSVLLGHHFFTCTDWKGEFVGLCFLVITSLDVQTERENLSVCVSWSSLLYMSIDWKGEFVSLCYLVITSLHVQTERENLSVCVTWSSLLYMCTDWKGDCFCHPITSLHVHWLKGRLFLSSWRLFLSSHHFFTRALIEREIVFVIPCLLVIHSLHVHWLKGRLFLSSHVSQLSPLFCFTCTQIERENGFVILHLCHPFFISAVTERKNICHILSLRLDSFIIICIYWLKKKKP